jgi:protein SCO1/2
LQAVLPGQAPVKLVTLTTDPAFDTPAVMKCYGERFGADFNRWLLLTGTKPEIQRLAVEGLKLVAVDKPAAEQTSPQDLFIHSTLFVIVDQQGRLRDVFDSTDPGSQKRVAREVKQLLRNP